MGRIFRYRRRRLKGLNEFDQRQRIRFWPDDNKVTLRGLIRDTIGWLVVLRPFILLGILISVFAAPVADPALVEPPSFLASEPRTINQQFTRCGPGRGFACVIDGDTFKLGERKVRIIGIDAPETHPPRCAEEARLGELATARLQGWLNDGPFEMVAPLYRDQDRYGRDLRVIRRQSADGYVSLASVMREEGLAHRYLGGFKTGWC